VTGAGVHTNLGANGAVGHALSRELAAHALAIVAVAATMRNPEPR